MRISGTSTKQLKLMEDISETGKITTLKTLEEQIPGKVNLTLPS
jgi:hypothetical protein